MEEKTHQEQPPQPNAQEGRYAPSLNRSCEPCRTRKVRCNQAADSRGARCERCEKMNLKCIFHAPVARQRRKRADVRIGDLERELKLLRSRLEEKEVTPASNSSRD